MLMKKELIENNKILLWENRKLKEEIERLTKLCDKYEEEHKTVFEEWKKTIAIIDELEKDIKNLYTYGIKNNAEQRNYLLNRLEELKEYKGSDKE